MAAGSFRGKADASEAGSPIAKNAWVHNTATPPERFRKVSENRGFAIYRKKGKTILPGAGQVKPEYALRRGTRVLMRREPPAPPGEKSKASAERYCQS